MLRQATAADTERLAEFNAAVHSDEGPEAPEEAVAIWTRDLFSLAHPTFEPGLATIVEDQHSGDIISTALVIPQTWAFEGIPFGVGKPELIATHVDYRNRGLVRDQMQVLHAWSEALGHRMQAIAGIPWYYRQFGYEMALELGGGRKAYRSNVPALNEGESEAFTFRAARDDDIPFLQQAYTDHTRRHLIACLRDDALWAYELNGRTPGNPVSQEIRAIENSLEERIGYITHPNKMEGNTMELLHAGLVEGETWHAVAPALMRYLLATGDGYAQNGKSCQTLAYQLGSEHPIFNLSPGSFPFIQRPYAYYIRIPDLPGFLHLITPVLERRLAASSLAGYSKAVHVNFYRSGLRMNFKKGRLVSCTPWQPDSSLAGQARFPDRTFLSLLCGRKTFTEMKSFFPDCSAGDEITALLEILFPKMSSNIWAVG